MTTIEAIDGRQYEATTYEEAVELVQAYFNAVSKDCTDTPSVSLCEASRGGFALDAWFVPGSNGEYVGFLSEVFVTREVAKRLIDEGVAQYGGYSDTYEAALEHLADNELEAKEGCARAYGSWHELMSYEDAYETCKWFMTEDVDNSMLGLARIAEECYELVGFGEDREGCPIGMDSEYVSLEVGRRLLEAGVADEMVLASSSEELDDPETYEQLRKEQFED